MVDHSLATNDYCCLSQASASAKLADFFTIRSIPTGRTYLGDSELESPDLAICGQTVIGGWWGGSSSLLVFGYWEYFAVGGRLPSWDHPEAALVSAWSVEVPDDLPQNTHHADRDPSCLCRKALWF